MVHHKMELYEKLKILHLLHFTQSRPSLQLYAV